jgi:hypothetical protein
MDRERSADTAPVRRYLLITCSTLSWDDPAVIDRRLATRAAFPVSDLLM